MRPVGCAIIIVLVAIAAGAAYEAYQYFGSGGGASSEEQFLEQARGLAEQAAGTPVTGTQPPVGADASLIPVAVLEPAVLDMGIIAREGPATGEIKVLNKGKANLEISQVKSSCGCTKAAIDPNKKTVLPGGDTVVTVTVDPKHIPGFTSQKGVTVFSNDPNYPQVIAQVIAKVDPEFELDPPELDFGEIRKGQAQEKTVIFRQLTEEPLEVKNVQPMNKTGDFEFTFVKRPQAEWKNPDKSEYLITARMPEETSPGTYDTRLSIQTTCKRVPGFPYTMKAKVVSFYSISPPSRQLAVRAAPPSTLPPVITGARPAAGALTATATITADRPFDVVDLKATSEDLVVSQKAGKTSNSVVIEVELKPDVQPVKRSESVTFAIKAGNEVLKERLPVLVLATTTPIRPTSMQTTAPSVTNKPGAVLPKVPSPVHPRVPFNPSAAKTFTLPGNANVPVAPPGSPAGVQTAPAPAAPVPAPPATEPKTAAPSAGK